MFGLSINISNYLDVIYCSVYALPQSICVSLRSQYPKQRVLQHNYQLLNLLVFL